MTANKKPQAMNSAWVQQEGAQAEADVAAEEEASNPLASQSGISLIELSFIEAHQEWLIDCSPKSLWLKVRAEQFSSQEFIARVTELKAQGFQMVLTDWESDVSQLETCLPYCNLVSLNLMQSEQIDCQAVAAQCREASVKLLVCMVESHACLEKIESWGADYLQGTFICSPDLQAKQTQNSSGMRTMVLLNTLQNPDVELDDVEKAVSQDARIAYRLLLTVNSAAYGLQRKIESLRECLVIIGLANLKRWITLIALSNIDNKPDELTSITMVRARMCELVAENLGFDDCNSFFTAGLFSTLDAMLDQPMETLLEEISLADTIKQALLDKQGEVGEVLSDVLNYENVAWSGDFEPITTDYHGLMQAYANSIEWTEKYLATIKQ